MGLLAYVLAERPHHVVKRMQTLLGVTARRHVYDKFHSMFDDLQRRRSNGPDPGQPKRILTGADFIARHVPPVWLIDGIVQRSRLYACTSLTGHGKTAVWLFNACMIHAGRMIGQLDVFRGNVLILAGENPADLEARMIGMAKTYNLPLNQLPYVLPGSFPMTEEEADALKRDIAGLGVPLALIVGDTASSFFPGDDENSNVQAGTYARTLRRFTECEGNPPSWRCVIRPRAPAVATCCRAAAAPSSTNWTATSPSGPTARAKSPNCTGAARYAAPTSRRSATGCAQSPLD